MQHLADRVALDDRVEVDLAVVVEADVDRVGVAEQVVQVAEDLLVGAEQERAEVVGLAVVAGAARSVLRTSRRSMNWSILPSESQVMSPRTARRVGASFSRWIGMIGKSCLIAQLSGIDWKIEKLQK